MISKRFAKRSLSLLLVLCMMLGLCPITVFAEDSYQYVSIGASNVNGYGLRGYLKPTGGYTDDTVMEAAALDKELKSSANVLGYAQAPAESYPALIREALSEQMNKNVKLSQLAISSMRAEELRILLDNTYNGDAYSEWRFIGNGKWFDIADGARDGDFRQLRSAYQTAVKNADLITVDIGVNNFGVYLSYMLTSNFALDNDLDLVDPEIAELYNKAKERVTELFAEYDISVTEYEEIADTLVYALVGFCYNFDKSMECIYTLNDDAKVVVVSIQNLMAGLSAKLGDAEVPLGDIIGALINTANIYIAVGSPYASKYLCADVRKGGRVEFFIDKMLAYDGDPEHLDEEIIDCFDVWDGSPDEEYDRGFHIKHQVAKLAVENQLTTQEGVADYLKGEEGKSLLNKAYDAYAQIMNTSGNCDALDLATLNVNTKVIEEKLTTGIWTAVQEAVQTNDYELPATFFSQIAAECNTSESVVKTVASMAVRTDIGNSFFSHPTKAGHKEIADTILAALENGTTGSDIAKTEIEIAAKRLLAFLKENGADALKQVVGIAEQMDWLSAEDAQLIYDQIDKADEAIQSGNPRKMLAYCTQLAEMLFEKYPEEMKALLNTVMNYVEELGAKLYDLVYQYGADALTNLVELLGENNVINAAQTVLLKQIISVCDEAFKSGDAGKVRECCGEVAALLYKYAVNEGYVPPVMRAAIALSARIFGRVQERVQTTAKVLQYINQRRMQTLAAIQRIIESFIERRNAHCPQIASPFGMPVWAPWTSMPLLKTPAAERPVIEEPVAEEPVIEEPVAEEPVVEEPVVEEPVVEEPIVEEPVVQEPEDEIELTVNVETETGRLLLLKWTKYTVQLLAESTGDTLHVTSVQYSTNNRTWKTGTEFTTTEKPKKVYVRVWDDCGGMTSFTYANGTVTKN